VRICLISAGDDASGELARACRRRGRLLAERHEVTAIYPGDAAPLLGRGAGPSLRESFLGGDSDLDGVSFSDPDHHHSALVLEAIERAYGDTGPDHVEACDRGAPALVPLLARDFGHPLLVETTFALRLVASSELLALHDGNLASRQGGRLRDLQAEQLRLTDTVVWAGGELPDLHRPHEGVEPPPATCLGEPFEVPAESPTPGRRDLAEPLRILFAGGLRRSQGALDLAEACLRLPVAEWRLTMVGGDTLTGPAGFSVQLTIEEMFGDDPRLEISPSFPAEGIGGLLDEHDLLVVPAAVAASPEPALEAMGAGMPILATPVGGLTGLVEHGVTGWLARDHGAGPLREALAGVLENREELERMRASGAIFERFRRLAGAETIAAAYERALAERPTAPPRRGAGGGEQPSVTGVVPYFRASAYVEEAVDSLLAQTHRNLDVVVVNDGSFEPADEVLERLAALPRVRVVTKPNGGECSARNLGIAVADGEFVAMLDSDNVLEPEFVARALEVFERDRELAYVSCWLRFVDPDGSPCEDPAGYAPLGNRVLRDDGENWDGDALALLPRALFAKHCYRYEESSVYTGDWELYRRLREDGRFGAVIPERLARYRVVPGSLQRSFDRQAQLRAWDEVLTRRQQRHPDGYWGEAVG
jgi:glycogen synthase